MKDNSINTNPQLLKDLQVHSSKESTETSSFSCSSIFKKFLIFDIFKLFYLEEEERRIPVAAATAAVVVAATAAVVVAATIT